MIRFKLRSLLIVVAVVAISFGVLTRVGTSNAQFEFIENSLVVDDQQRISGKIRWSYRDEIRNETKAWQFICSVKNLKLNPENYRRLLAYQPGDQTNVNYRYLGFGPFKKQDPFTYYVSKKLGIDEESIVGYAWFDGWTEVVINGR